LPCCSTTVPNPRAPWSAWQSEDVYDTDDQFPARLSRFGLVRAGENRIVLIVVVGVLVGVLALAAVLGYVVFHALSSTERTTVGAGEVEAVQAVGAAPGEMAGIRMGPLT
jgi:hypothetical protein